MNIIYKYEVELHHCHIIMPKNAVILKVGVQNGRIFLWASINENEKKKEKRYVDIYATGEVIPNEVGLSHIYLDTIFVADLVWHVFYK